ncbi:MAG: AraC family transcriptional regulator [Elusimicrobia bacterium]|nr:AraC family transcriptional regulator [Elusimicrobiota bacterium]
MKVNKYSFPFPDKNFPFLINTNKILNRKHHVHPFVLEFHYVRSGKGFLYIKDRQYATKPKSLFIIHEHDVHTYLKKGNKIPQINITLLVFSKFLLDKYTWMRPLIKSIINCHKNFPHQLFLNEKEANDIELILHMIETEWKKKGDNNHEAIKALLVAFLIQLKRSMSKKKKNIGFIEEHNPIIDKVLDYIDKHFKEHITLSGISKQVKYSSYHISHLFKKFTGLSFKSSIANRRVLEAKRILETDNNKHIVAIASEVGFSNLFSFNRNFKRLTDTTPSLYRKFCMSIRK